MKRFVLSLALMTLPGSLLADAQTEAFLAQGSCRAFVRQDESKVLVGSSQGLVAISADGQVRSYDLGQVARDALFLDQKLIVLVGSEVWVLDPQTGALGERYQTQKTKDPATLKPQEMPRTLRLAGSNILIAHGTLGVSVFDWLQRSLATTIDVNGGERVKGMVQDIGVKDSVAYLLIDNYQISPARPSLEFRGFVLLDLQTLKVGGRIGGLDPGATTLAFHEAEVLVSFAGMPVWKLELPLNPRQALAEVAHPVSDFGRPGHSVGHFSADAAHVWTCHREGSQGPSVPALYDRTALGL
jgi:hypothetical protein